MYKQFTSDLANDYTRPVAALYNWNNVYALLDTGAVFPVWTANESDLTEYLGAVLKQKDVPFSGFGGSTKGNLYELEKVHVGELVFPRFSIVACRELTDSFS